jgi:glycosyltransferase involved in cell wall biosynthesis
MSSNQTIEKLKQAAEYEKAGNTKKAFRLYSELLTDLNSPVWLKMKIQRLQGGQKTPGTSKTLQHAPIVNKPLVTSLNSEIVPVNSIEIKKDKIFDSLNSSWEEWTKEFGPGQLTIEKNSFTVTSNGERYYLSKEFNFKSGRSYEVTVQLGEIKGEIGHLVALVKNNGLEGDVDFLAKNAKSNDSIVLNFSTYDDTKASLRIGLGTTTKVNGEAKLVVTGLCIYETILPENNYKLINEFCRDYIDPELILPNLIPSWNNYSEIDSEVQVVKNNKDFSFIKKISIIIPAYERIELLRKTLASIECQSYPKELIEVVIVDDGSTIDNFENVFNEFSKRLTLYLTRQERKGYGLTRARNLGARVSSGEILFFLDSDLILPRNYVASVMYFHHVADSISVLGVRKFINSETITVEDIRSSNFDFDNIEKCKSANPHHKNINDVDGNSIDWRLSEFDKNNWLLDSKNPFRFFGGGHASVSRARFFSIGGYDESFNEWGNEDQEFAYRLWAIGQKFIPLKDIFDYHQEEPSKFEDQAYKITDNKKTNEMLISRCPDFTVRAPSIENKNFLIPLFSIYIPAFNVESYIQECIDSVLAQTYQDFEVVIVNDGSTDGTAFVLEKYKNDNRVKIINKSNGGIGSASNAAIKAAKGEYIVQLDSDDTLSLNALEELVVFFNENPTAECVYTKHKLIDADGKYIGDGWSPSCFDRYENLIGMSVPHLRSFRRSLYYKTSGFNEIYLNAIDYDFYLKLSNHTEIKFLDKFLYNYRIHPAQTSTKQKDKQEINHIIVVNDYLKSIDKSDFYALRIDPYHPQRNFITKRGSKFEFEKKSKMYGPQKLPDLRLPDPKGPGNDYTYIQNFVQNFYKDNPKNYSEKISIIVPVYNRAERLSRCLAGIFHQSYPRELIEVVVVDDGSSDAVIEVIKKYSKLLNLKYAKQHDDGYRLSAARNLGIRTTTYRNISIIDCDLIPLPGFIESFMQYLHHFDNVVLLGHQRFVDPTGISDDEILKDVNRLKDFKDIKSENSTMLDTPDGITVDWRYKLYDETNFLKNDEFPYRAFSSGHVAYRRTVIEAAGYYDEDFNVWGCEDNEAGYRIYQQGFYFIPVLEAVDLHQEPPSGKNETNREADRIISRKLLQEKLPAMRGWFGEPYVIKPGDVPLFSVCIPIYNTGHFVIKAIESVLNQSFQDFEVLIYDDASSDGTLQMVKEKFLNNSKIRIMEGQVNRGVTYSRKILLENSCGEFVAFLDSDDLIYPDTLVTCLKYFRGRANVGLVCTEYEQIDEEDNFISNGWSPSQFDRSGIFYGNIFTHMRVFRLRDWNRSRKWSEKEMLQYRYGEDWDLCIKLAEVCDFDRVPFVLYKYRINHSGITNSESTLEKFKQSKYILENNLLANNFLQFEIININPNSPHSFGFIYK